MMDVGSNAALSESVVMTTAAFSFEGEVLVNLVSSNAARTLLV